MRRRTEAEKIAAADKAYHEKKDMEAMDAPSETLEKVTNDKAWEYFEIAREMREADEAILKKHGLTWKEYAALEEAATTYMISENKDVVELDKRHVAMLYRKPVFLQPSSKVIGTNYSIRIKNA